MSATGKSYGNHYQDGKIQLKTTEKSEWRQKGKIVNEKKKKKLNGEKEFLL